jgi:phosphate uptake regulator
VKRKVNLVGTSTLTVSLPSKWCSLHSISKGDELEMSEQDGQLCLSKDARSSSKKDIEVDVSGYTYANLVRMIHVLYKGHYDKIVLRHSHLHIHHPHDEEELLVTDLIQKATDRIIGAEIVHQTSELTEIQCVVSLDEGDLDNISKRIYFLLKDTVDELFTLTGDDLVIRMKQKHDLIMKFVLYYKKLLSVSRISVDQKMILTDVFSLIDFQADKFRELGILFSEVSISRSMKSLMKRVFFEFYLPCLKNHFIEKGEHTFSPLRFELLDSIKKMNLTSDDGRVLSEVTPFLRHGALLEYSLIRKIR